MQKLHKSTNVLIMLLTCALIFALTTPALSGEKPVGKLTYFSGDVIMKSKGSWAAEPTLNHPLYSSDKVVTRLGKATITFNDGAVVQVANNSNLLIKEQAEKEGVLGGTKTIKRRLRLILGKLSFRTGISKQKRDTTFETPTAVCAIRGTAGTLSVDGKGQAYISYLTFTEGGAASTVGDFISGVAPDMPTELADMNPAQRAAFVAKATADLAREAAREGVENTCYAMALEAAAREAKIQATIMLNNNPDPEVVAAAKKAIEEADKAIQDAVDLQEEQLKNGASACEEDPETYTEEGLPGIPVEDGLPEFNQASPV